LVEEEKKIKVLVLSEKFVERVGPFWSFRRGRIGAVHKPG
jgi:hypothetical protein